MKRALIALAILSAAPAYAGDPDIPRVVMMALFVNLQAKVSVACSCSPRLSIGTWSKWPDVSDWRVVWPPSITPDQQSAGQAALIAFNPADPANQSMP